MDKALKADVIRGLSAEQKFIPSKYLYDEEGMELFERICGLDEYYITRTELGLLERCAPCIAEDMADADDVQIVEFGSGSDRKIRTLLKAFDGKVTYIPIDICAEALEQSSQALRADFPDLEIIPLENDFTQPFVLPSNRSDSSPLGFFPGSTIGNLAESESLRLMHRAAESLGADASFLLGIDLKKNTNVLCQAYNDEQGVTAAFSLNLLKRLNRELAADFVLANFRHHARWDDASGAVEIHLVSLCQQHVHIGEHVFSFREGEGIHTETSRKYTLEQIESLARHSGWVVKEHWVDDDSFFSLNYLERI